MEKPMSDAVLVAVITAAGGILTAWLQNRKGRRR
jgi:hypothetical protein